MKIKKKENYYTKFFIIAISLLVIYYIFSYFNLYKYIVTPIHRIMYISAQNVNNFFNNFDEISEMKDKNKKLLDEVNYLLNENTKLKIYRKENVLLKEQLRFVEEKIFDKEIVVSRVIAKNMDNKDILSINKGKKDGIIEGLPVIASNGIIVGKISSVSLNTSKVLLLRDPFSFLAVKILDKSEQSNLLKGKYGLSLQVDFIPRDVLVEKGDIVVTSGIEENIPLGLIVGKVERIEKNPNDLFIRTIIQPRISYDELNILSVILPSN